MTACPKCGKNISARKLLYIKTPITCPTCGSGLRLKNKGTIRLIGGVEGGAGGVLGVFFVIQLALTGIIAFLIFVVVVIVVVFFTAWITTVKFARFEPELHTLT